MKAARATVVLRIWELPLVEERIIESNLPPRNILLTIIRSYLAACGFLLIARTPSRMVPLVAPRAFG